MSAYSSTNLSPRQVAINATVDNILSCIVQSYTDKYRVYIYDNSDNSLDYDSGDVSLSATPLFQGETLYHTLPLNSLANGKEYKWQIKTYNGTENATSLFALIRTNVSPVITFAPPSAITSQSATFTATYTQAQSVPINYTQFEFYDINNELILQTDKNYTGRISYTFEGFLNSTSYSVKIIGYTANNVYFETAKYNFTVSYDEPSINVIPTITQDDQTSIITVAWGGIIENVGVGSGSYNFVLGGIQTGNKALQLVNSSSYVTYTVDFTQSFSLVNWWKEDGFTTGKIIELLGNITSEFGYDGSKFYYTVNGITYNSSNVIISGKTFITVLTNLSAIIRDSSDNIIEIPIIF